jgi:acyl-CoA synthetase (AMP-forming)/AMP-acid ligase II
VVTFLFTDVEGSTRRWEADAEAMRAALLTHDEVLRNAIDTHEDFLFGQTGDGVAAAFASPRCAVDAAVVAQRELVVGVPDEDLGQVPYAFVQVAEGAALDEAAVTHFLRKRIDAYKVPRTVEFVDSPLRDDAGKARRSAVRDEIIARLDAAARP